jgi:uncharacterized membrane protein YdbT with pleckstrin-like domain
VSRDATTSDPRIPRDIVLEPGEHVLVATKPLAVWLPVAIVLVVLWAYALFLTTSSGTGAAVLLSVVVVAAVALTVVAGSAWLRWRARWYVLTDRRIISRWGILNRVQSAILLERLQDVTLEHPFPLSMLRGYGVLRLESAGEHSEVRIPMEHADEFHRTLTQAITPSR